MAVVVAAVVVVVVVVIVVDAAAAVVLVDVEGGAGVVVEVEMVAQLMGGTLPLVEGRAATERGVGGGGKGTRPPITTLAWRILSMGS